MLAEYGLDKEFAGEHSNGIMSEKLKNSYCLVLGGGGARGAYEIGVWKALREMEIEIHAVAGTSVGALNAALVAQNDYEAAEEMFLNINIHKVINIPDEYLHQGKISRDLNNMRRLSGYLLEHRGLDTSPLKSLINSYLKEDIIRSAGMDFALVTYNLSTMKPLHCFIEDIPAGRLSDFLAASAAHPLFGAAKIDEARLTDGGVTDNIPYNLMKERGYRRIIAVDLSGMGWIRKPRTENSQTVYIKNSLKLDGIMDFTPECSARAIKLGYLDTLRSFEKVEGVRYFINPGNQELEILNRQLKLPENTRIIEETAGKIRGHRKEEKKADRSLINPGPLKQILPPDMSHHRIPALALIECSAACLNISREPLYTPGELLQKIEEGFSRLTADPFSEKRGFRGVIRRLRRELKKLNRRDLFQLSSARYASALSTVLGEKDPYLAVKLLSPLFPELPAARLLYTLINSSPRSFSIDQPDR